jgi:CRISPR type III-A-associated protein Csm2
MANGRKSDQQRREQHDRGQQQQDSILAEIEKVQSFSEITAEKYATPGGFADQIAEHSMKKEMKTTQLRKFFSKVKNLETKLKGKKKEELLSNEFMNDMYMILPELAYSKARGLIKKDFYEIITTIIRSKEKQSNQYKSKLKTVEDFRNFSKFMTAIVAYKKLHGG